MIDTGISHFKGLAQLVAPKGDRASDSSIKLGLDQFTKNIGPGSNHKGQVQWNDNIINVISSTTSNY